MEMDADAFSITSTFIDLFESYKSADYNYYLECLKSKSDVFEIYGISLGSVFMFLEKECPIGYDKKNWYLPTSCRLGLGYEIINRIVGEVYPDDKKNIIDKFNKGMFIFTKGTR